MDNGHEGNPPAERISLPESSRVYVVIHNASHIEAGYPRHISNHQIPDWVLSDEGIPNVPEKVYISLAHGVVLRNLVVRVSPINVRFNKNVESQCFIRDDANVYKARLFPENYQVLFNPNNAVVMVQASDSSNTRWIGVLERWQGFTPNWVQ